ncbi:NUDIX domain-containing protein [Corynebacterium aquatimens]|uniref:8-oxo-dGTP pyrophosphatase MutT (NUDIX family) n=1 Tax=Corynebacterium aquatimens TaxID=1190508 RepID=A0A931DV14_9CORY|nr:NUDIX domain-containing protein [Corynebacterium aquatimens]MBG6122019.1 8-oxo-dGTP pyrophosphatase MutT (NUDIX family) [Corynebacterium aquatimens]WJY65442.1 dihydroneopterin triphosphate pyrophosphatase [Corynebacterium aquatimens]
MPIPEFIVETRKKIGKDLMWLPSVTAVVLRDSTDDSPWATPEVLLVKRSDNGAWTPVTGICDPGEEAHEAAEREVREETGIDAKAVAILGVGAVGPVEHANGDMCSYMATSLRLEVIGSELVDPVVGDDESSDVGWFSILHMPVEDPRWRLVIADAVAQRKSPTSFAPRMGLSKR